MLKILLLAVLLCNGVKANAQWTLNYQTLTNEIVEVTSSPDSNTCWFITNFDRLYKTSNGGANWTMIVNGVTIPSDLFVLNNDTAFKSGASTVWRTTNGGESWNVVFSKATFEYPVIWMKNNSEGVISYVGKLYKTTDGGTSWSFSGITQPPLLTINSSGKGTVYSKGDDLWVAERNNGTAYSSDFGNTWNLPSNTGLTFNGTPNIYFGSVLFGIAITHNSPFVYITTDGANSWHIADNSLGANEDVVINDSHCWYIPNPADHFYIKYSADSGSVWTQQLTNPSGFNNLEKSRTGNTIWAGTTTGKIYKYSDQVITRINEAKNIPSGYNLKQNFPNPFNPSTKIKYNIPVSTFVSLRVYDLNGRQVSVLMNGIQKSGYYEINFDGKDLSSGIYFYELEANGFIQIKQMLLLK